MKTLRYFFFIPLAMLLMASDCSNEDNEFYNDVFITSPDLLAIDIPLNSEFNINDVVYIASTENFARNLAESGQGNLDIFRSTGGARTFSFTYVLERQVSGDNWEIINLTDKLVPTIFGSAEGNDLFATGHCAYDEASGYYVFANGIKLTQPGNYRLSFGYNSDAQGVAELRSDSADNNLFLNITSNISQLDGGNFVFFTVLP